MHTRAPPRVGKRHQGVLRARFRGLSSSDEKSETETTATTERFERTTNSSLLGTQTSPPKERDLSSFFCGDDDDAPKRSDDRRCGNDGVGRTGSRIRRRTGMRRRVWRVSREARDDEDTSTTTVVECIVVVFGPDVRRIGENVRFGGSLSRAVYRDRPAATAVSR